MKVSSVSRYYISRHDAVRGFRERGNCEYFPETNLSFGVIVTGQIGRVQSGLTALGGPGAAPTPGMGHLPGDGTGRAGLWGAGDRPCCSIAGAGAETGPRGTAMRSWA